MGQADLVIEAATEREGSRPRSSPLSARSWRPHAILATNTSSISITRLARHAPDPARFMGVHFFNPVPVMRPIELIRGLATSGRDGRAVEGYAQALGKTSVHVADSPGFVVNRVLLPFINEAVFALGEGSPR
jgi:3-hydroxybutyryl-CoA dehydrogenase